MEHGKRLPSDYSDENLDLDEEIEDFMVEFKSMKTRNYTYGLCDHQLLDLADSDKRQEILQTFRKNTKMVSPEKSPIYISTESKSGLFNLPLENSIESRRNFDEYRISSSCNCMLGIVAISCAAMTYDLEYNEEELEKNYNSWIRISILGTITTVVLLINIILSKYSELKWEKSRNYFAEYDGLRSSGKFSKLLVELLLNAMQPLWLFKNWTFESYNEIVDKTVEYNINSILSVLSLVKLSHTVWLIMLQSKFSTGRAYRVCKMNAIIPGSAWTLKCMIKTGPLSTVIFMLVSGVCIGGFCLRIFEKPYMDGTSNGGFDNLGNCMWFIMVTMTTIGFGEFYPVSVPGRLIGVLACGWGVLVVSLMMYGATNLLMFDPGQEKSFALHLRLKFKEKFKILAAYVLRDAFRFKVLMKKIMSGEKEISLQRSKYKRNIIGFQRAKLNGNILYQMHTPEAHIEKHINEIADLADLNYEKARETFVKMNALKELFENSRKELMKKSQTQ